jgi:hypothetical protein
VTTTSTEAARRTSADALGDRSRRDAVLRVPGLGVEDGFAVHVSGRAPNRLDQRSGRAQEALLVGVEDRHQRDLGKVEALAQQVDAHQHVELAEAQIAQDLHPFDGVDVGMEITHLHPEFGVVLGQVLGHALGESGDKHTLVSGHACADLRQQVVDLAFDRPDLHHGIHETGGANHLLDEHSLGPRHFVGPGRGRDVDRLTDALLEFREVEGSVVDGRRHAEAVLHQRRLALTVACGHPAHLGHTLVRLIDDEDGVLGEVVDEGGGRFAGGASGKVARVVLDAVAASGGAQHLEVEPGPLTHALGFEELALSVEGRRVFGQFRLDLLDRDFETRASA